MDGTQSKGSNKNSRSRRVRGEMGIRKTMLALALVVVLVPLFAAVALAAEGQLIQCNKVLPCVGSKGDDKILERIGDGKRDQIIPKAGDDLVLANKYTNDEDVVS